MLIPQVGTQLVGLGMSLGFFLGACLALGILMVICMYNLEFKRKYERPEK